MDELLLDKSRLEDIGNYMTAKKYAYNSWKMYMFNLVRISKKYKKIDNKIAFKLLQEAKNPNQIAILSLINEYCVYSDIDFFIKKIRVMQKPRKIPRTLSIEEIKALIEKIGYPENIMIKCLFNIGGGLRIADIVQLNFDNFNWETWFKDKTSYGFVLLKKRKRGKEIILNVPNTLMQEIYNYALSNEKVDSFGFPFPGLVFDFESVKFKPELREIDKERWIAEYIKHSTAHLQFLIKKAGYKDVHTHTFRHSKASYLYNEVGLPIEQLKEIMGHENINSTLIYANISKKKIFEKIKDVASV